MSDASNKAFADWARNSRLEGRPTLEWDIAREAFEAGWQARKKAQYGVKAETNPPAMYSDTWPNKPPTLIEAYDHIRDAKTAVLRGELKADKEPWS